MFSLLLLLTLARSVSGFTCSDDCVISDDYVADGWCDCTDCGDETEDDCNSCFNGCPTACGGYTFCGGTAACTDGCIINATYIGDGACDCSNCEDEALWTCGSCPYCPQTCGDKVVCVGGSTTPGPSTTPFSTEVNTFTCVDTCVIDIEYVDDGWCDCLLCDDESQFTCDSCGGCPFTCGGYIECTGAPGNGTTLEPQRYICNDGCKVDFAYVNDGYCDCLQCEEEPFYTCESCPGCPTVCGNYQECTAEPLTTGEPVTTEESPTTAPPMTTASGYLCDDGCVIDALYVNDAFCDCTQCEEEPFYTCESCPGCPETCGAYVGCTGEPQTTEEPPTTEEPASTEAAYICGDGCEIDASYVNDDWCDCFDCGDEDSFTCESCGGCPETCGAYVECAVDTTEAPVTTDGSQTTDGAQTTEGTRTDAAASAHLLLPALMGLLYALYSL